MKIKDQYPVFVSKQLKETRDFYISRFNFEVYFESSFFILLKSEGETPHLFGFIDEIHPSSPPVMPAMTSESGVFLTLEVDDADAEYTRFLEAGYDIYYHLKDEPWGQKRFGLTDPNGMYIDIVQQTEPEEHFWDQYMNAE